MQTFVVDRYTFNHEVASVIRHMLQCHEREVEARMQLRVARAIPGWPPHHAVETAEQALDVRCTQTAAAIMEFTDWLYDVREGTE